MENVDMIEIIRLMRETGEDSLIEKVVQGGGDVSTVKTELRKCLVEEPLKERRTLSDLSGIKKVLETLGEKLNQEETDRAVEQYLEEAGYIGEEKGRYHWHLDQLLTLTDIGSFSPETADKILRTCFNEGVSTTAQLLELLKRLMPMASKDVREAINNWYFREIEEKEMGEDWKVIEINRDTMIAEANKVYGQIVFRKSCVISGSLTAREIEAEGNLVIFGDLTVKRIARIEGDLTVTGKLGGEGYPEYWHGICDNAAYYEIGGNLIADKISPCTDIKAKGNIISQDIGIVQEVEAKNIFTPGNLVLFYEGSNYVTVRESVVADSIITNADNRSYIKAGKIECTSILQAENIKANEIRASEIKGWLWLSGPKKLEAGKITKPF